MPIWTPETVAIGLELPQVSRQWSLEVFATRHENVYGRGNLAPDSRPAQSLHSTAALARREGLSAPVASAPQLISLLHRMMMMAFGAGWIAGGRISVKMIKPVFETDFTTGKGCVTGIETEQSEDGRSLTRVTCSLWVERRDGTKVLVGDASAVLA